MIYIIILLQTNSMVIVIQHNKYSEIFKYIENKVIDKKTL